MNGALGDGVTSGKTNGDSHATVRGEPRRETRFYELNNRATISNLACDSPFTV